MPAISFVFDTTAASISEAEQARLAEHLQTLGGLFCQQFAYSDSGEGEITIHLGGDPAVFDPSQPHIHVPYPHNALLDQLESQLVYILFNKAHSEAKRPLDNPIVDGMLEIVRNQLYQIDLQQQDVVLANWLTHVSSK